jgi:hypothetical protein
MNYEYILGYDIQSLTTAIYNSYGEVQSANVEPVVLSMTTEEALELVRKERNKRLLECDWTQLLDVPLSLEEVNAWKEYRQKLRDLPNDFNWNKSVWPTKPF